MSALEILEIATLRELRYALARGGLPSIHRRTPEDCARITSFRAVVELIRFLNEFERRIANGERCRIVEREYEPISGRLRLEFAIEVVP